MRIVDMLRKRARLLKADTYALYLAYRDLRTPWYARVWIGLVVAYALSPLDLIPDFIPVLGLVDDLILVPLGLTVAIRMLPDGVLADSRERVRAGTGPPISRVGLAIVVGIWLLSAVVLGCVLLRYLS
jgi:uncharacterized membrane protein YkvA (DUF1232 family)